MVDITVWGALLGAGLAIGVGGVGAGLGEGLIASKACETISRQPAASGGIVRLMLISQAVTESVGIFSLLTSLILLFVVKGQGDVVNGVAYIMAGFTVGFGSIGSGIGAALPGMTACEGVARKPENETPVMVNMLMGEVISQTSGIFALMVALMLIFQQHDPGVLTIAAIIGAGISMGFGAIGTGFGTGFVAMHANRSIGKNVELSKTITNTMLVGQAVTESVAIYALVVALILLFM